MPQRSDLKAARKKKTGLHRTGRRRVRVRRVPTSCRPRRRHRAPSVVPSHPDRRRRGPLGARLFFPCGFPPRRATLRGLPSRRACSSCPCCPSCPSYFSSSWRRRGPCLSFSAPSLRPGPPSASAWPPAALSSPRPSRLVLLYHRRCHRRLTKSPVSVKWRRYTRRYHATVEGASGCASATAEARGVASWNGNDARKPWLAHNKDRRLLSQHKVAVRISSAGSTSSGSCLKIRLPLSSSRKQLQRSRLICPQKPHECPNQKQ